MYFDLINNKSYHLLKKKEIMRNLKLMSSKKVRNSKRFGDRQTACNHINNKKEAPI